MKVGIGNRSNKAIRLNDSLPDDIETVCYSTCAALVSVLLEGAVDAGVRGTFPASELLAVLKDHALPARRVAFFIMKDQSENHRLKLLFPVGIDEQEPPVQTVEQILHSIELRAHVLGSGFVSQDCADPPRIGILANGHSDDAHRSATIARSLARAEILHDLCSEKGLTATMYGIELERALPESDIIVAPDGVVGNVLFRVLYHFGGIEFLGAVYLNLPFILVDSSSSRQFYDGPVRLAAHLVKSSDNGAAQ